MERNMLISIKCSSWNFTNGAEKLIIEALKIQRVIVNHRFSEREKNSHYEPTCNECPLKKQVLLEMLDP
jgi:hypothetical protein